MKLPCLRPLGAFIVASLLTGRRKLSGRITLRVIGKREHCLIVSPADMATGANSPEFRPLAKLNTYLPTAAARLMCRQDRHPPHCVTLHRYRSL
jgi:hypothetical protein